MGIFRSIAGYFLRPSLSIAGATVAATGLLEIVSGNYYYAAFWVAGAICVEVASMAEKVDK